MVWGSRLASLILLLLAGYAAYQIMICRSLTIDPAKLWDLSSFYISRRLALIAAVFVVFLAMGGVLCGKYLRKDWLIFLVPAIMIVFARQAVALAGFLIQSMAGLAIGIPIYRRLRSPGMPRDLSLTGLLLSWFLGGAVNAYTVWIALHWKINYSSVYFCVALLEMGVFWRPLAEAFNFVSKQIKSIRFTPGQWAIVLWTIFILPHSLVPSYLYDEYLRHVFFPKQVALFGQHIFDPNNVWSVDTEVFSQSYYTISYLLGGEYVLRFANLASIVAAMLLLEDFCYRHFGLATAFFAVLSLVFTPLLGFFITCIYLEPFNFLSVTVMMIVTIDGLQRLDLKAVILSFVLAAIGFLYKQQAVFYSVPLAVIFAVALLARSVKKKTYWPMAWLAAGIVAEIIVVVPFMVQNYILTKNPLFPWLNGIFRSEFLPPVDWEGIRFDHEFSYKILAELTFHGEKFWELGSFPFGVNFFVLAWFIPLAFIKGHKTMLKLSLLALFAASLFLWWKITSPNMRYFIGPLSAGSILLGLTMSTIWERIRLDRLASSMGVAALTIAMTVNAAFFLNTVEACCSYPLVEAFTRQYGGIGRLSYSEEVRKVFLTTCAKFGKDASCLLVWSPFLSLADQRIEWLGTTYCGNWTAMRNWRDAEDAFDWIFRNKKFTCVIMPEDCNIQSKDAKDHNIRLLWSPRFREMVSVEFAHAGFLLMTPKTGGTGNSTEDYGSK